MEQEIKEKIKLTVREVLLNFLDLAVEGMDIFNYGYKKKIHTLDYEKWRGMDKSRYYQTLWRLEKQGYLKRYKKNEKTVVKLTPLGEKKALKYLSGKLKIISPEQWDKKWRIVIFDIPEDKKNIREIIREKLKILGFYQLQKSVFVFPFDCKELISYLKYTYASGPYLQYILAENIETEIDLLSYFYDQGLLNKTNLKKIV